ncbi:MAG: PA14 domain-containing protein [Planctomycetota bacterium]|nr:PA14 domain-containing protein [Planctomycetota bacterium]
MLACSIFFHTALCDAEKRKPEDLKKLIAQAADPTEAADALRSLSRHADPWRTYAALRLTTLADAGLIPKADPDLIEAWQGIYSEHVKEARWPEANRALSVLTRLDRRQTLRRLQRGDLLARAGRMDLAVKEYLTLSKSLPQSHSNREMSSWLSRLRSAVRPALTARANAITVDFDDAEQVRRRFWLESIEKRNPKDAAALHSVMKTAFEDDSKVVSDEERLSHSFWLLLDRKLLEIDTAQLAAFRKIQDARFQEESTRLPGHANVPLASGATTGRFPGEAPAHTGTLKLWRRYPFSAKALKQLFEYAVALSERGAIACAARSFEDIIAHSSDQSLIAKAKLALNRGTGLQPASPFTDSSALPAKLNLLEIPSHHFRLLRDNPSLITIQSNGTHIIAAAPTFLACYDAKAPQKIIWLKTSDTHQVHGGQSIDTFIPDANRPSISSGRGASRPRRIFARWGFADITGNLRHDWYPGKSSLPASRFRVCRTDFAAFDLMTGEMYWSTAGAPYWNDLLPAGDPMAGNGRVYLPAAGASPTQFMENKTDFLMLCLDAGTGELIWKKRVGEITIRSYIMRRQVFRGFHTSLAFEGGTIFCNTGAGLVAALDARDGLVEWSRTYPGYNPLPSNIDPYLTNRNPPPQFADKVITFSAKDTPGAFALNRHTGALLSDDPFRAKNHTPLYPNTSSPIPPSQKTSKPPSRPPLKRRLKIGNITITAPPGSEFTSHSVHGGRIRTCSLRSPAPSMDAPVTSEHFRIDAYDSQTGMHLAARDLFHICPSTAHSKEHLPEDVTWSAGRLTIKNDQGIHHFALPIPTLADAPDYQMPVHRASNTMRVDGLTSDYSSAAIPPTVGSRASLHLSRNSQFLFLAVSCPNPEFRPLIGRGRFGGGGDWLEVSLRTNRKPNRELRQKPFEWDTGIDNLGRTIHHRTVPDNLLSVARYDINRQTSIYEMAIPLESICKRPSANDTRIQLNLSLYDNPPSDPAKAVTPTVWRGLQLRLLDFTRDEEQAAFELARNIPHLNESHWILKQLIRQHVHSWPAGKNFINRTLKQDPSALFAARILQLADRRLLAVTGQDLSPVLAKFAARAGLAPGIQKWYSDFIAHVKDGREPNSFALPRGAQLDTAKAIALLRQNIPRLRRTEAAVRFFTALVELAKPKPAEEISLLAWFLKEVPGQSRDPVYMEAIWELANQSSPEQAVEVTEKIIGECNIPAPIAHSFRRKRSHASHAWLRQWHIVGPFPSSEVSDMEFETVLPPVQKKITLREGYRVQERTLRWKKLYTESGTVHLEKELGQQYPGAKAYAVTFIESPKAGWASLELAFHVQCRAWLNRRLVFRSNVQPDKAWVEAGWKNRQEPFARRTPVWLPKGWCMLLVECANGRKGWQFRTELTEPLGKGALVGLRIMQPGGPKEVAVTPQPAPDTESFGNGLRAEFYDNVNLLGPRIVRKDPFICVDWKVESPDPRIQWETWSARWTGKITPKYSEPYTFIIICNDGVRMWIDGKLLIDHWSYHSHKKDYGTIELQAGKQHEFQIEFYEFTDWSNLWLWWRSPSQKEEIVPPSAFTSNWYRVKTYGPAIRTEPPRPSGPPRFAGLRISPKEIWMPPGWKYQFKAIPLDQYGKTLDVGKSFDPYGKPFDVSVKWSVIPGGRINLLMLYGGGYWLEHRLKKAKGTITQTGLFTSDGSFGCVTTVAQSAKRPGIRGTSTIAIENYMSIQPDTSRPLSIGGDLGGRSFDGDIDRARIYKIALTDIQILAHFKGEKLTGKGVVADWTFDKLEEGFYRNQADKCLDGKPVGRVKHVRENNRAYVRFEGGRIEVAHDKRLNITKSCTFEAWIRPRVQRSQGVIFDKHLGGTVRGHRLDLNGGVRAQGMFGHGWLEAGHLWATDFWSHLVAVYDVNGVRKIYVDGKLIRERKKGVQIVVQ